MNVNAGDSVFAPPSVTAGSALAESSSDAVQYWNPGTYTYTVPAGKNIIFYMASGGGESGWSGGDGGSSNGGTPLYGSDTFVGSMVYLGGGRNRTHGITYAYQDCSYFPCTTVTALTGYTETQNTNTASTNRYYGLIGSSKPCPYAAPYTCVGDFVIGGQGTNTNPAWGGVGGNGLFGGGGKGGLHISIAATAGSQPGAGGGGGGGQDGAPGWGGTSGSFTAGLTAMRVTPGQKITIKVGAGGSKSTAGTVGDGGAGANGFVLIQ
jgi:hypothetical protein